MENDFWTYLSECGEEGLQNVELLQFNIAAQLKKTMLAEFGKLIDAHVKGELARLLRERGDELSRIASLRQKALNFDGNVLGIGRKVA